MSAPADGTIRSSRSRFPSPRPQGPGCWSATASIASASRKRWRAGWWRCAASARPPRCTSPSRVRRSGSCSPSTASSSAPTSSSTGITRALRPSTISSPRSIRATASRSSASGAMRLPPASPSTGSPAATSPRMPGTPSSNSTWRPGSRKWGRPYLTREFFSLIGETMSQDVLLVMARRNGRWIAGAINFIGSDTLFGRNWGAVEHHPFLHFEVCYYQAIDFAIKHGLDTRRGRRAGRAQDRARLPAADDPFRPLHRRSRPAPRHRRLPQARARLCRRGRTGAGRARPVPQRRRRGALTVSPRLVTVSAKF